MRAILSTTLFLALFGGCSEPDGMPFGTILGVERVDAASAGDWVIDLDERGIDTAPETLRSMLREAREDPNGTASRHITDMDDPIFAYLEEEREREGVEGNRLPTLLFGGDAYRMVQVLV